MSPSAHAEPETASAQAPGRRVALFIARLVARDVARGLSTLIAAALAASIWLHRIIPPPQVRADLIAAAPLPRALTLIAALALYLRLTAPLVRTAIASRRLAYLRQLPISPGQWRGALTASLALLHAPWLALAAYGVAPLPWPSALGYGLAWAGATLDVHVTLVHLADRRAPWRLGRRALTYAALAGIALRGSPALAGVLGALACGWAIARLGRLPPEPARAPGLPGLGWLARRPTAALARLELITLIRRAPRSLALVGALHLALGLHALMAFRNGAARPGDGLPRFLLTLGCLAGPALALAARRALDRDRWYLDALPVSRRAALLSPVLTALCVSAPVVALTVASALTTMTGPRDLLIFADCLVIALWLASVAPWLIARGELRRALDRGQTAAGALALALGLATLLPLQGPLGLLGPVVVTALLLARAAQLGPRADAARRRFETSRDDDDHDQP